MPNSRHSPAIFSPSSSRATNLSRSSIGLHSFQGILLSPQKAQLCNPCARNELSPLSQEGQNETAFFGDRDRARLGLCRKHLCHCLWTAMSPVEVPLFSDRLFFSEALHYCGLVHSFAGPNLRAFAQ